MNKINDRNKHKNRRQHQSDPRNKIQVIIKNDGMQGCMVSDKIINFLCNINHNGNRTQQKDGEEKSNEELFDDIPVECFQEFD